MELFETENRNEVLIVIRTSKRDRSIVKEYAKTQNKTLSDYIKSLISNDMKNKKKGVTIMNKEEKNAKIAKRDAENSKEKLIEEAKKSYEKGVIDEKGYELIKKRNS